MESAKRDSGDGYLPKPGYRTERSPVRSVWCESALPEDVKPLRRIHEGPCGSCEPDAILRNLGSHSHDGRRAVPAKSSCQMETSSVYVGMRGHEYRGRLLAGPSAQETGGGSTRQSTGQFEEACRR